MSEQVGFIRQSADSKSNKQPDNRGFLEKQADAVSKPITQAISAGQKELEAEAKASLGAIGSAAGKGVGNLVDRGKEAISGAMEGITSFAVNELSTFGATAPESVQIHAELKSRISSLQSDGTLTGLEASLWNGMADANLNKFAQSEQVLGLKSLLAEIKKKEPNKSPTPEKGRIGSDVTPGESEEWEEERQGQLESEGIKAPVKQKGLEGQELIDLLNAPRVPESRPCPQPGNRARDGSRCGFRSAYYRGATKGYD